MIIFKELCPACPPSAVVSPDPNSDECPICGIWITGPFGKVKLKSTILLGSFVFYLTLRNCLSMCIHMCICKKSLKVLHWRCGCSLAFSVAK